MLIREVLRARNRESDGALPAQRDRQRQSREKAADAARREDGDAFAVVICKFVRKQSLLWNVVEITHHRRNHQWAKELAANVGFLPWPPDCGRKKLRLFPPLHLLFPAGVHPPNSDPRKGADQASP